MQVPDSPKALIRAGFYIGLGIGLAYLLVIAVFYGFFALGLGLSGLWDWLNRCFPHQQWAAAALMVVGALGLLATLVFVLPLLRTRGVYLRNRMR